MNRSVSTMTGKTKIKIVLLGNQSVGKSSVIEKYVKNQFDQTSNPTVGIDFLVKNITHGTKSYRLQLWDTAGQQRFRSLIPNYLKDAKCALIVIDVSNRSSLNSADMWLKLYNENCSTAGLSFLIGNKIDLEYRQITQQQASRKAQQLGLHYYQISAKTGQNIEELFLKIIDVIQQKTTNFQLNKKQSQVIKQQQIVKQQDTQLRDNKTKMITTTASKPNNNKNGTQDVKQHNIILKNEEIKKSQDDKQGNKGCC